MNGSAGRTLRSDAQPELPLDIPAENGPRFPGASRFRPQDRFDAFLSAAPAEAGHPEDPSALGPTVERARSDWAGSGLIGRPVLFAPTRAFPAASIDVVPGNAAIESDDWTSAVGGIRPGTVALFDPSLRELRPGGRLEGFLAGEPEEVRARAVANHEIGHAVARDLIEAAGHGRQTPDIPTLRSELGLPELDGSCGPDPLADLLLNNRSECVADILSVGATFALEPEGVPGALRELAAFRDRNRAEHGDLVHWTSPALSAVAEAFERDGVPASLVGHARAADSAAKAASRSVLAAALEANPALADGPLLDGSNPPPDEADPAAGARALHWTAILRELDRHGAEFDAGQLRIEGTDAATPADDFIGNPRRRSAP